MNELEKKYMVNGEAIDKSEQLKYFLEKSEKEEYEVRIDVNQSGESILVVNKEGYDYALNSLISTEELVNSWADIYDMSNFSSVALVFGISDGRYIRELRKRYKDLVIIVYEPSYSIASTVMQNMDILDIVTDEKNMILVGNDVIHDVSKIVAGLVEYENINYFKLYISPNYKSIFEEEYKSVFGVYDVALNRTYINRNTVIGMASEMNENSKENLMDYIEQYALPELKNEFDKLDLSMIPAIVVAAGPSLDKNIMDLKLAKNKAFIVAVDTALNSLDKKGIVPDIGVTVDPHKPLKLFDNNLCKSMPLLFTTTANHKIKQMHSGIRIYQSPEESFARRYDKMFNKPIVSLETGGSVAHDAFSFCAQMGFRTIIFVGQDLAYPNNQEHSVDSYGKDKTNVASEARKDLYEVEDIYGGKVKTEGNMDYYRKWFEQAVIAYSHIKFIDATEGGAKKKGMEILTLKEAIARECKKEFNFSNVVSKIEKHFNENEKQEILRDIANIDEFCDYVKKRLTEGKKSYEKLDELNRKGKYSGSDFKKAYTTVEEINSWICEDVEIRFINMYNAEDDYKVREVINNEKNSTYEEVKHISKNGIKMMETLMEAVEKLREDMQEKKQEAKEMLEKGCY